MIHRIVQFALQQRFVVLMFTVLIIIAGADSFRRMPVDAYPDLSPPMVELITQWPGHAAEEVERLTTLPLELAMNGSPHLKVMRSISLYVLSDPAKLYNYRVPVVQVVTALNTNNSNTGGGFYTQGGQFYYVRGLGLVKSTEDIGEVVVGSANGVPIRVKDIGHVEIGHAPRLGIFGFQDKSKNNDDAVEGVILMRRGEQTQNVLEGVEKKTAELNRRILPPDVKVRPYYDRSDLVRVTTDTVEWNLIRGMVLVLIVLIFFLVSVRAAVITALTIPLALLFAFIFLNATGEAANLLSIGAIDFGIIIDGTIVMVENIYRELSERHGQDYKLSEVLLHAARDVDRPIFYSVAVIIAGYLPIYALTGPAGKLFHPIADTMAFALVGALILTLTVVPVIVSYAFKKGVEEKHNRIFQWIHDAYAGRLEWCLDHPKSTVLACTIIFAASLTLLPFIGGEFLPHLDEGALWVRATMPYTIAFEEAAKFAPQVRSILTQYPQVTVVGSELGRPDD